MFCLFYYSVLLIVMVGGGVILGFGEILLVYNGVFFFDELFEFERCILDVLRELIEFG